jgi:hypothetical protein
MIRYPTVFVIGAGASIPFGFPSGSELLRSVRLMDALGISNELGNFHNLAETETFRLSLVESMADSIDGLLEVRSDLEAIGRKYIARKILVAEDAARSKHNDAEDWLAYLFQKLSEGCPTLESYFANPVSFITYNYDRLIEFRLMKALKARYRADPHVIFDQWKEKPVIHLHGSVGELDDRLTTSVPFGARMHGEIHDIAIANVLRRAADSIKVVHQADGNSSDFAAARRLLDSAANVVFLGFGFGRTNVDRLDLTHLVHCTNIICSTYGLTAAEIELHIRQPFLHSLKKQPFYGEKSQNSLEMLREKINFLVSRY